MTLLEGATSLDACKCGFCSCTSAAGETCNVDNLFYTEGADSNCRPDETGRTTQRIVIQSIPGITELDLTGLGESHLLIVLFV